MTVLEGLQQQPLFAVCLTVAAYAAAEALWRTAGKPAVLTPVLTATLLVSAALLLLELPYGTYLTHAEPLHEALGIVIVLLAVPLCRQFRLIRESRRPLISALVLGSFTALVTALALPALAGADQALIATIAPKSSTAAVAVEVSSRLLGLPGLTAVTVIATGIFGAAFGPPLLDAAGVTDDRARGFALGLASHAIGTARAFQISETAGAFASVGMILNALLTIALAPIAFTIATGGVLAAF